MTRENKTDVSELDSLLQQVKTPAVTSSPASSHLRGNLATFIFFILNRH